MLKELRHRFDLTQAEVADAIGRSPNFVLKAEQLTFPVAPAPLVEFYIKLDNSYDHEFLREWYLAEQKKTRESWLSDWAPVPAPDGSFRNSWVSLAEWHADDYITPTEYRLSAGLCLPAAVVFNLEHGKVGGVVIECLDQLIEYVESGRYFTSSDDSVAAPNKVLAALETMRERLSGTK